MRQTSRQRSVPRAWFWIGGCIAFASIGLTIGTAAQQRRSGGETPLERSVANERVVPARPDHSGLIGGVRRRFAASASRAPAPGIRAPSLRTLAAQPPGASARSECEHHVRIHGAATDPWRRGRWTLQSPDGSDRRDVPGRSTGPTPGAGFTDLWVEAAAGPVQLIDRCTARVATARLECPARRVTEAVLAPALNTYVHAIDPAGTDIRDKVSITLTRAIGALEVVVAGRRCEGGLEFQVAAARYTLTVCDSVGPMHHQVIDIDRPGEQFVVEVAPREVGRVVVSFTDQHHRRLEVPAAWLRGVRWRRDGLEVAGCGDLLDSRAPGPGSELRKSGLARAFPAGSIVTVDFPRSPDLTQLAPRSAEVTGGRNAAIEFTVETMRSE